MYVGIHLSIYVYLLHELRQVIATVTEKRYKKKYHVIRKYLLN